MSEVQVYTMNIETNEGVKQYGFHLGTIKSVAETFVFEQLRKPEVKSVGLNLGKQCDIYDWRDLPEYNDNTSMEDFNYVGNKNHY